jgi:hypothetical protein
VEYVGWMVHPLLECAVSMRKDGGTAAETHALAQVVSILLAEIAIPAIDTCLDGDTLTWNNVFNAWSDCGDDASCFMSEN